MTHMQLGCIRYLMVGFVIGLAAPGGTAEKTPIRPADVYRFDVPTDLVVAPDGKSAVYARKWSDAATRQERHALWLVEGSAENRRALELGEPDARRPVFSPDGNWIAFLSTRPLPDGTAAFPPVPVWSDPAVDIWFIPASGGKAIPLCGRPKPYGRVFSDPFYARVSFSPDGRMLAFIADDGADVREPAELSHHVHIVRDDQGEGYEGFGPAQVWVAELADLSHAQPSSAATRVRRLTHDDVWYGDVQWSPDGAALVVHANRTTDRESVRFSVNKNFDLWRIRLSDGAITQLTTGPGPEVSPRFAPDGKSLLCLSVPRKGSHADVYNLLHVDLSSATSHSRVLFDHHASAGPAPHLPPMFPLPLDAWLSDERVFYSAASGVRTVRQVVNVRKPQEPAAESDETLRDRDRVRSTLAPPANPFLAERLVAASQAVRWKSFDGKEIEGVLTLPPTDVQKPHKLLLFPHGGPHSRSTLDFNFTAQVFAAAGYAVFQPNFRGSAGYGQAFIDADRHDLGGGDMQDILYGIEHLVRQGIVDPNRQFVYGVSYGGFMTSWLIGQTRQFKAAAPQNAVTDLTMMWALSDLQSWTEWEFGGKPWEVAEILRARSPLTHAGKVRTPTLILHAARDRRCPLPMGAAFYRALRSAGVPTQLVIYPDERHGIIQLPHQEDVLNRVLAWFEKHGEPAR